MKSSASIHESSGSSKPSFEYHQEETTLTNQGWFSQKKQKNTHIDKHTYKRQPLRHYEIENIISLASTNFLDYFLIHKFVVTKCFYVKISSDAIKSNFQSKLKTIRKVIIFDGMKLHIYIYIYIYIHTHTYIHIQIYNSLFSLFSLIKYCTVLVSNNKYALGLVSRFRFPY